MRTVVAGRDTKLTLLSGLGYVSIGAIVIVAVACGGRRPAAWQGPARHRRRHHHRRRRRHDAGAQALVPRPARPRARASSTACRVVTPPWSRVLWARPCSWRPAAYARSSRPAGGFATTFTGASTIVAGWHRPADVVAALAVSLVWTGLVALFMHGPRHPVDRYVRQCGPGLRRRAGLPRRDRRASGRTVGSVSRRPRSCWARSPPVTALFVVAAAAVSPAE